jgi:hypothetical protein
MFIITPLSNATIALTSVQMNNAQGWLSVGFISGGFLLFFIIKIFIWDYLDRNVENSKIEPFMTYLSIKMRHQSIKSLNLHQLEELEIILQNRSN